MCFFFRGRLKVKDFGAWERELWCSSAVIMVLSSLQSGLYINYGSNGVRTERYRKNENYSMRRWIRETAYFERYSCIVSRIHPEKKGEYLPKRRGILNAEAKVQRLKRIY